MKTQQSIAKGIAKEREAYWNYIDNGWTETTVTHVRTDQCFVGLAGLATDADAQAMSVGNEIVSFQTHRLLPTMKKQGEHWQRERKVQGDAPILSLKCEHFIHSILFPDIFHYFPFLHSRFRLLANCWTFAWSSSHSARWVKILGTSSVLCMERQHSPRW